MLDNSLPLKLLTDMEALEAQRKEKEAAAAAGAIASSDTTTSTTSTLSTRANYTPDYAAGLIAPAVPVCM